MTEFTGAWPRGILGDPKGFYVQAGTCLACDAPIHESEGLVVYSAMGPCQWLRQPCTPEEVYRALRTLWCSDVAAHRYGGEDRSILRRLHEMGCGSQCDHPISPAPEEVRRDLASFLYPHADSVPEALHRVARRLEEFCLKEHHRRLSPKLETPPQGVMELSFSYAWHAEGQATITVLASLAASAPWRVHCVWTPAYAIGVTTGVDDALRRWIGGEDIRWHLADDYDPEQPEGSPYPI